MGTKVRNYGPSTPTPVKVMWGIFAVAAGLMLTFTIMVAVTMAQQPTDFDLSYKIGPQFAETNDLVTYTIVAVNAGDPVTDVVLLDPVPNGSVFSLGSCTYRRATGSPQSCSLPDLWQEDFVTGDRITTTFAVQVTEGTMGWSLINCAYLNWDGNQKEMCFTTTVNPSLSVYLPLVMRNFPSLPDLRVVSLTVEPSDPAAGQSVTITVTVQNVGGQDAGPFWVDLYDNPDPPSTRANQPFDQLCSGAPEDCYGIGWYVDTGLSADQSVMLSSLAGYMPDYSRWPGCFVDSGNHDIYAFAASWDYPVWCGAVLEQNEGLDNR